MQTKLSKWGNSLGFRIPTNVVNALSLKSGDEVSYKLVGNELIIKKQVSTKDMFEAYYKKPYDQITAADIGDGGEMDWGGDFGGEVF